jgi:predicted HTH domain antitoxin
MDVMTTVALQLDNDVFATLRMSPDEVSRDVRLAAAIRWYAQGRLSQGKAAEVAGISRAEFIDALSASGVSASQVTPDELRAELARG